MPAHIRIEVSEYVYVLCSHCSEASHKLGVLVSHKRQWGIDCLEVPRLITIYRSDVESSWWSIYFDPDRAVPGSMRTHISEVYVMFVYKNPLPLLPRYLCFSPAVLCETTSTPGYVLIVHSLPPQFPEHISRVALSLSAAAL